MRRPGPGRAMAVLLVCLAVLTGAAPADEESPEREVYVPLPDFRAYRDVPELTVEAVRFIRVRRDAHREALVARTPGGWERVVVEGRSLAFYSQGRQPLRPGPDRHVIVQDWSGGAHCCFDYYVLHVHGEQIRREAMIRAGDCSLRVADLDGDGAAELIACDGRFAYAFDLPFAESPLLPVVYSFREAERAYRADNRRFPQVFRYRIAQERRRLEQARRAGEDREARRAVLSILLHMLYAGRVTDGWCTFGREYRWADREAVWQEVVDGLREPADPDDARVAPIDLRYATARPGRCR
ncbi:MAG: hypothetical protein ACREM9_06580 [Gemmatimonadales bacterium]